MTSIIPTTIDENVGPLHHPAPPRLEPLHPPQDREGHRRGRQRHQRRRHRQRPQRIAPQSIAPFREHGHSIEFLVRAAPTLETQRLQQRFDPEPLIIAVGDSPRQCCSQRSNYHGQTLRSALVLPGRTKRPWWYPTSVLQPYCRNSGRTGIVKEQAITGRPRRCPAGSVRCAATAYGVRGLGRGRRAGRRERRSNPSPPGPLGRGWPKAG